MPLKEAHGNMYNWVTHMHTHLGGECPHKCAYCYVGRTKYGRPDRYVGDLRLIDHELRVDYGRGKVIFIEHMNDLFAEGVKDTWIFKVLDHCKKFPENRYVFQTKNPERVYGFRLFIPHGSVIGTTIETNRPMPPSVSRAPEPVRRYAGLRDLAADLGFEVFVTIEPIMDLDVPELVGWLKEIKPAFVNIGADSKGCKLVEPPAGKVRNLIAALKEVDIPIRKKVNLDRILNAPTTYRPAEERPTHTSKV